MQQQLIQERNVGVEPLLSALRIDFLSVVLVPQSLDKHLVLLLLLFELVSLIGRALFIVLTEPLLVHTQNSGLLRLHVLSFDLIHGHVFEARATPSFEWCLLILIDKTHKLIRVFNGHIILLEAFHRVD